MSAILEPSTLERLRISGPYKGLAPFEESELDALLFFGRELERDVIEANLFASRLTVLYGPTGVGKSSLLRAGVVHNLRRRARENAALRGHPDFAVVLCDRWNDDPVTAIAGATEAALADLFGNEVVERRGDDEPLVRALERWTRELDCDLLLVLDQGEEYFLYHEGESGEGTFAEQLPELVRQRLRVNVLLSLREDQLAKLDRFKGRIPNLFSNYLRVDHLDPRAATLAIVNPLAQYNRLAAESAEAEIEPELVEAIVEQTLAGKVDLVGGGSGVRAGSVRVEAPYLQLVLQRLWEEERDRASSVLRLATLTELGGAEQIARTHLERALDELADGERDIAASVFLHLVTPSGTKIAHAVGDLAEYTGTPYGELDHVLAALARERILKPVQTPGHESANGSYEIFHDVLGDAILAWRARHAAQRALERARAEARRRHRRTLVVLAVVLAGLAAMTAIATYAVVQRGESQKQARLATANSERAESLALIASRERERAQQEADRAREQEEIAISNEKRAVINEEKAERSAAAAAARANEARRDRSRAAASAAEAQRLAVQAEVERDEAKRQRRVAQDQTLAARKARASAEANAREAQSREFTARALASIDSDPEEAVRFALRAARLRPTVETESALRQALIALRVRGVFAGGGGPIRAAAFSKDGRFVLLAPRNGNVQLFSLPSASPVKNFRHGGAINDAVLSDDGRWVAIAGRDERASVWDVATARRVHSLPHEAEVNDVDIAAGRLVTASADQTARVWNLSSGILVSRTFVHSRPLRSASFSPDGSRFVTVGGQGDFFARVFKTETATPVAALEQAGVVIGAWWSPKGTLLVTGGNRNAYVWEVGTWRRRWLLEGHTRPIRHAAFSSDEQRLLTLGDGLARMWRLDNGTQIETIAATRHELTRAAFSPDGQRIVIGGDDRVAGIWSRDATRPNPLAGHDDGVTAVDFHPGGELVMTASLDGTVRLWEARGDPVLRTVGTHGERVASHTSSFSADGTLVLSAGADGTARVWRRNGRLVATLTHQARVTRARWVGARLVLTGSDDGTAALWRVPGNRLLAKFKHGAPVRAIAATGQGARVVTGGEDGIVRVWSSSGAAPVVLDYGSRVNAVAISSDGNVVVAGGAAGTLAIWAPRTGRLLHRGAAHEGGVVALALDPRGSRVATAGADGNAAVWSLRTGRPVLPPLEGNEVTMTWVAFNRSGTRLITADGDGDVRRWNARTGAQLRTLKFHVSTVSRTEFSPNGRWIVTAGPTAAGIWDASSGELLLVLRGHTSAMTSASFAPDSRSVVTSSTDGTVRIGRCDVCTNLRGLRALAKARLAQIVRLRPAR